MAKQITLSALFVLLTIAIITAIGWGVLYYRTNTPAFLDRESLPVAQTVTAENPASLDAVLDGPSTQNSAAQQQTQIEQLRRDTLKGLQKGLFRSMLFTALVALTWTIGACMRSRSVGGVSAMRSAQGMWALGLIVIMVVSVLISWLTFRAGGGAQAVDGSNVYPFSGAAFVLAILGYFLATAIGAPTVLRTSVPLATMIIPVRRASR